MQSAVCSLQISDTAKYARIIRVRVVRIYLSCTVILTYIEDITCLRVDMNFIFKCSTRYLTSERSSLVRYRVEHDISHDISHTNNDVFDDFPKISDHFRRLPKIFQNYSEGQMNVSEHFSNISRRLPKISEHNRRFPRRDR